MAKRKNKPLDQVLKRELASRGLTAERALEGLVRALVDRHVDIQLRRAGRRPPFTMGNERPNALVATMDALHEARYKKSPDLGDLPKVQELLFQLLTCCQFAAEDTAGLNDEEEEDQPPIMRIVRDD